MNGDVVALQQSIQDLAQRVAELQRQVLRMEQDQRDLSVLRTMPPDLANLSNIREMYLMKIIRDAGLLEKVDLEAITAKVRARHATGIAPWGASEATGRRHLDLVLGELSNPDTKS